MRVHQIAVLSCLFQKALAAEANDEVLSLPGWNKPLPSKHYSGYLTVGSQQNRHLHYYFILSEAEPAKDPVTLWLQGGPGSSSVAMGMMTEIGPLVLNRESLRRNVTGAPSLQYNPYTWAKHSNLLFLESPAGVGFSKCDYEPCESNDTSTAEDAYDALRVFFTRYEEFSKLPFFITGESYAGIYCPTLAEQIMDRDKDNVINLQGLAVGNGCWGNKVGTCAFDWDQKRLEMEFQFGHSMFPKSLYKQLKSECKFPEPTPIGWEPSADCAALMARTATMSSGGVSENIYDFCLTGNSEQQYLLRHGRSPATSDTTWTSLEAEDGPLGARQMWCGGRAAYPALYEPLPAVHAAWHVSPHSASGNMRYTRAPAGDLRPLYAKLARKYRLLIFSGDADGCVPHTGTEEWTYNLGFDVSLPWRPWSSGESSANGASIVNSAVLGYVTKFGGDARDFSFATVMGAGHEVPTFRPDAASTMINRFLRGAPLSVTDADEIVV